jgi:DNA-directed RNA polymerase specialized sigma24 family protein
MSDEKLLEQVSRKLSALIALAMVPEVQEKNTVGKVALLNRFGLSNQEMADILGTTKGTVEVLKSRLKPKK